MSEKLKLGHIITDEQAKDAVHVAVAPVTAGARLQPATHVKIVNGIALPTFTDDAIGVVDPFLEDSVKKGERFWLFLYPGSITSLRHDWTHPAFVDVAPAPAESMSESEKWLRDFGAKVGFSYGDLLDMAADLEKHQSAHGGDDDTAATFNDNKVEFMRHLSVVTGRTFKTFDVYFSCAC